MGGEKLPVLNAVSRSSVLKNKSSVRDLLLAVVRIVSYMVLGVLLYTFPEINYRAGKDSSDYDPDWKWNVIDCCYFTMVTITTVGYGDMTTLSQPMRVVTAFFGLIGVVQIAGSLNVIADWFVERARKRFLENQRALLGEAEKAGAMARDGRENAPAAANGPPVSTRGASSHGRHTPESISGEGMSKSNPGLEQTPTPPPSPPTEAPVKQNQVMPVTSDSDTRAESPTKDEVADNRSCLGRCLAPDCLESRPWAKWFYDRFIAFLPCLVFIVLCFILGVVENVYYDCYDPDDYPTYDDFISDSRCWTPIDMFYYSIITLATIGYGDVTPHSIWGRLMATLLIPFAIVALTTFMGNVHQLHTSKKMGMHKTLSQRLEELKEVIEQDDNQRVTPEEFILFNLKKMNKIDADEVELLRQQFNALDFDQSGELDEADITLLQEELEKLNQSANAVDVTK